MNRPRIANGGTSGSRDARPLKMGRGPRAKMGSVPRVIARTHKGHGVSFMSDQVAWHHHVPTADEYGRAVVELQAQLEALDEGAPA